MTCAADSPREQLLRAAVAHLCEHGVGDRSLRSIAAAIGTSHRMLLYHFGSRDALLAEVVATVETEQRAALAELAGSPELGLHEVLGRMWARISTSSRRYGPLLYELTAHAMQGRPHAGLLRESLVEPWVEQLAALFERAGRPPEQARAEARLALATARGLLHDALITGRYDDADEAFDAFLNLVPAPPGATDPSTTRRPRRRGS